MPVPQKKMREIVFQILYALEEGKAQEDDIVELLMKELKVTKKTVKEAFQRVRSILKERQKLDQMIASMTLGYQFERIQTVEKNILRLASFELMYDDLIPAKVAISEAVRLSKKFSSPESVSFVNAILDAIYKKDLGESSNSELLKKSVEDLIAKEEDLAKLPKLEPQHENDEENDFDDED